MIDDLKKAFWPRSKEIEINRNQMVPLVGTYQYGDHVVRVINKEDFTEACRLHAD